METIVYLPGYLSPGKNFAILREYIEARSSGDAYRHLELPRQPTPDEQYASWAGSVPEGAHLVAHAEAGIAACRLAIDSGARSLVLFSPFFHLDTGFTARLEALRYGLESGGVRGFAKVAAPWLFGMRVLGAPPELLEAWREGLLELDLDRWLGSILRLGDERKYLRLVPSAVLVVVGSEDVFTPMRYAQEVTEWVPEQRGVLVITGDAGHYSLWENPREALGIAGSFIERYEEFLLGPAEWRIKDEIQGPEHLRFDPEAPIG